MSDDEFEFVLDFICDRCVANDASAGMKNVFKNGALTELFYSGNTSSHGQNQNSHGSERRNSCIHSNIRKRSNAKSQKSERQNETVPTII